MTDGSMQLRSPEEERAFLQGVQLHRKSGAGVVSVHGDFLFGNLEAFDAENSVSKESGLSTSWCYDW